MCREEDSSMKHTSTILEEQLQGDERKWDRNY